MRINQGRQIQQSTTPSMLSRTSCHSLARRVTTAARPGRRLTHLPRIGLLIVVGLAIAALLLPLATTTAAAQSSAWSAAFTGKPAAPTSFNPTDWDVQVHSRDTDT